MPCVPHKYCVFPLKLVQLCLGWPLCTQRSADNKPGPQQGGRRCCHGRADAAALRSIRVVKGAAARPSIPSLVMGAVEIICREGEEINLNVKGQFVHR